MSPGGLLLAAARLYLRAKQGDGPLTEQNPAIEPDPRAAARRLSAPELPRRFYKEAQAVEQEGSFHLHLDGRPARTPASNPLAVPTHRLAAALEEEWNLQADKIDAATMPVTRLANSAIDGVAPRMEDVRADVLGYAGSDLLCYRAGEPEGLAARQAGRWDPVLAWAERRLGARFVLAEGVMHVAQPAETLDAFAAALARFEEPFALAGLHVATTLTGSALLALALAEGGVGVDDAWAAAHVDEDWNMELWGEDAEALSRRARRFEEFRAAALALGR
ncbi:MAG TPA: ATP12 family protein [Afifellaceae bacterium]|nr:ATP12 family protein [Afifellaceae bacterium]